MRHLTITPSVPPQQGRRVSNVGVVASPLSSPNQSRYKGIISTPGYVKFSAWKRESDIPRVFFHDFILKKLSSQSAGQLWMKDISSGRYENFGTVPFRVSLIASGLTKLNFKKGDVITMYCSNHIEYWLLALAAWSCGGCVMPANFELDGEQLVIQMEEANTKILVCDDVNFEEAFQLYKESSKIKQLIVIGSEGKSKGCISMNDLIRDDGCSSPQALSNIAWDSDPIYLPFTSTSTEAKGVIHTHKSLVSQFYSPEGCCNHWFDQLIGDSVVTGNWFFHLTGLNVFCLAAIYGISVYCMSEYSDISYIEAIVDNKVASATAYAWQIRMLSQSPVVSNYDLSCLKHIITGGNLLGSTIRSELLERIPSIKYIRETYGLTECGLVTMTYPRERKIPTSGGNFDVNDDHMILVGLPTMYVHIKIIEQQTGQPVIGPDEQGEICIKSPMTMTGYLNRPAINKKVLDSEGFFHTGDLGFYDASGVIHFIERIEDLIHFWMYDVAPSILESRLLCHNNIVDAAVVGISNKENGQVPRAFVVLKPGYEETEENLINFIESRLEDHERLRGGMIFVQSIPRDENWRIKKKCLMEYDPEKDKGDEHASDTFNEGGATCLQSSIQTFSQTKSLNEKTHAPTTSFSNPDQVRKVTRHSLSGQDDGLLAVPTSQQELYGQRNRGSRRGSSEVSQEGSRSGRRRSSLDITGASSLLFGNKSCSSSRRASIDQQAQDGRSIQYWLQVKLSPKAIEVQMETHPAVEDCLVVGIHKKGVGEIPRAYVSLKPGYEASAEELLQHLHSNVDETERLRAGLVIVDHKIPRDNRGNTIISLEKFEKDVHGFDHAFLASQPKINVS